MESAFAATYPPAPVFGSPLDVGLLVSPGTINTSSFSYSILSSVGGFPGFSAFMVSFDFLGDATPTLAFSLSESNGTPFILALAPVPEPSSLLLFASGLALLGLVWSRRKRP